MGLTDPETGQKWEPLPVTPPEEVGPQSIRDAVGRAKADLLQMIPRAGAMTAGAEIGGAVGEAAFPVGGGLAGAAIGSGIANVISGKTLPPALGGDKSESTLGAFATGAIPEGAARGIAGALEKRAATKAADAAHAHIVGELDKGPMPAEQAGQVAEAMGRTTLARPPILTGDKLTDATNSLRKDILDPITATRRKLGEPIGEAYKALKGETPIPEQDVADLASAAQGIQDSMISPFPKAKAALNRIKSMAITTPEGKLISPYQELPGGEIRVASGTPTPTRESLIKLQGMSSAQADKIIAEHQPVTLDQLRELRQVVNTQLRSAKGGDVHALAGLQQAIDEKLMPFLPAGINRDRELYRGFIQRFPWRDINKINQMGTPRELGAYVFGGTPERAAEIIEGSSPQGRVALREALVDHALNAVNPDAPLEQQVAQVHKVLTPYIADQTAAKLFGKEGADQLREVFYAPVHRAQMAKIITEQKDTFVKETASLLRGKNKSQQDAIDAGFQKLVESLPPPERAQFTTPAVPGAEMPVLPSTGEAMKAGMQPGKSKLPQRMMNRAQYMGPYAGARAMTGSPAYAIANLAAMAGIATTSAGYRAIMENGGASAAARFYASPNGRAAARVFLEGLAALGTQGVRASQSP